jgi:hypothetical protein
VYNDGGGTNADTDETDCSDHGSSSGCTNHPASDDRKRFLALSLIATSIYLIP